MTRKQKRAENKRRHRALKRLRVTTYDDLIRRDRNPRSKPGRAVRGAREAQLLSLIKSARSRDSKDELFRVRLEYRNETGHWPEGARNPKRDGSPTRGERKAARRAGRSTGRQQVAVDTFAIHSLGKSDTPADRMFLTDAYRPGAEKNEDIIADIQIALDEGMFSHTTGKRARVWLDRVLSARRGKSRRNPTAAFRARGKLVRFHTKPKRRGPVPKHLRPYLFKSRR